MTDKNITIKIAKAVIPFRKRSERMIGYTPYSLHFEMHRYDGVSAKQEKTGVLENTIIKLIGNGVINHEQITKSLGLDLEDVVEKDIYTSTVLHLRKDLDLIDGSNDHLSLTENGLSLLEKGSFTKKFSRSFELYIEKNHISFPYLKECVEETNALENGSINQDRNFFPSQLNLKQLQYLAEYQASHMQFAENGMELQSAKIDGAVDAVWPIYVCFVQSIRDNSVRTIIYDRVSNLVIGKLSELFDNDIELRDELLAKCLKNEVDKDNASTNPTGEKTEEQIKTETKILSEVDAKGEAITIEEIDATSNVGRIYDSAEFEKELNDIFEKHYNEEIWLISPWIKSYAFLQAREPMIRKFLDQGGAIFIGYSEPERAGEEMVDFKSMTMVKSLDESYDKFYYAELPKFHMKNVIEYKRGVTNLYTGSFNILSFCINGSEEHYRMEQMTFANHKEADLHRNEYIALFLNRYVQIFKEKISSCARGQSLDLTKIDYLSSICESKQETEELMYAAKDAGIEVHVDKMPNEQGLIDLAQKVIDLPHNKDPRYIQAKWAAILYKFEYSKKKKDLKRQSLAEFDFQRFICFNSVHQVCRISMRKGKIDHKKSIVNIVCNDINFEFAEINLPRKSFDILNKHKQRIFFQEENIKSTRFTLNKVLFTSIREIGIK